MRYDNFSFIDNKFEEIRDLRDFKFSLKPVVNAYFSDMKVIGEDDSNLYNGYIMHSLQDDIDYRIYTMPVSDDEYIELFIKPIEEPISNYRCMKYSNIYDDSHKKINIVRVLDNRLLLQTISELKIETKIYDINKDNFDLGKDCFKYEKYLKNYGILPDYVIKTENNGGSRLYIKVEASGLIIKNHSILIGYPKNELMSYLLGAHEAEICLLDFENKNDMKRYLLQSNRFFSE